MDRRFDGVCNFRFSIPFRIIPPIRRGEYKKLRKSNTGVSIHIFKKLGTFGKKWICKTVNSVIKRKFTEMEREEETKERMALLLVYNIHLVLGNKFFCSYERVRNFYYIV